MKTFKETIISIEGKKYKVSTDITGNNIQALEVCHYCPMNNTPACSNIDGKRDTFTGKLWHCSERSLTKEDGFDPMNTEYYIIVERHYNDQHPKPKDSRTEDELEFVTTLLG